ncbi:MAG: helix-turn-helix domain-containing protein [Acidimicrobiia bacterium]|jgi:AcrR family transcriptional regulator
MTAPAELAAGPRRSILAQDRSRRTREALVDAAFALWTERGFETGFEATTVEEIARAAGVTKGTFYFHFARKVDVLLDMNAAIDQAMTAEMLTAVDAGEPIDVAVARALAVLAERTERMPRAALAQILREYHSSPVLARERSAFRTTLPALFAAARARTELPHDADPERLANLVAAIILVSCAAWAEDRAAQLAPELHYAAGVLFAGIHAREHA